jgi:hypothetical protein
MVDLSQAQEWKVKTNEEYQKVIEIMMNLATASLVLPVLFLRDFIGVPKDKPLRPCLSGWAFSSWGLLLASLVFAIAFHWASAKFVKTVFGGPESWSESTYELLRDGSVWSVILCFLAGLVCMILFFATSKC